jgi:uncharacterized protein involved in type VI secretion and phage assembly
MPGPMIEQSTGDGTSAGTPATSILTGVVTNNFDLLAEGKVLVRLPSIDQEVWARMTGTGGGPGTGFFHAPNIGDEVLVALNQNNVEDSFVLGGLWSMRDRPPVDVPGEALFKRTYKTGLPDVPLGHEIEFDDLKQSITITTSTKQTITMDPEKIELSATGGQVSITLNVLTQSITIQGVLSIDLKAVAELNLSAAKVSINGDVLTEIKGGLVTIN